MEEYITFGEKYIPTKFEECNFSLKTNTILNSMLKENELPNIALYGTEGSGKYTKLMIMLKQYYGDLCDPYKRITRAIDIETGSFVELPNSKNNLKNKVIFAITSKLHCEIELRQPNAMNVLIPFLAYYSNTKNIYLNIHKYVILRNVEILNKNKQNSLRKIIENSKIKFMITVNSLTNLIYPLRSRFLCISVCSPSIIEVSQFIKNICEKEKIKITPNKVKKIIEKSYYGSTGSIHLNELFLSLEAYSITSKIYVSDRNEASDNLIKEIKKGNRDDIRNIIIKIYEIMKDDFILIITGDFFRKLLDSVEDDKLKKEIVSITAYWNYILKKDYILNPIFHAEAYIYAICDILKW